MQPLLWLTSLLVAASVRGDPTVTVKNGTYAGVSLPSLKQDIFLGMPFAQQPVPPLLRLRPPEPLNTSWHGVRDAKAYSPICYGYDVGTSTEDAGYELSEACLTMNVIRPAGVKAGTKVPVVAWIYGGGFFVGGSSDPRFNGSWIVEKSVEMGQPIIFASFNYRLTAFGFLYSKEVRAEKIGNFGLFDQRLALRWIHENIAAFGGDPSKVTIMGESAGAMSVALHLTYGGQTSTNLYRAAILESGTATTFAYKPASAYQPSYDAIVNSTTCVRASDSLACLRSLPVDQFVAATNRSVYSWAPVIDGVFLTDAPSRLLAAGKHVRVPLIIGQNTDEGVTFGPKGLKTSTDVGIMLKQSSPLLGNASIDKILELYPDDPFYGCPFNTGDALLPSGRQDKRSNAIIGDLAMHAGRRQLAQIMSRTNGVYSYRFDQPPDNATILEGTGHFQEVAYVFSNPLPTQNTLSKRPGDAELATYMTSAWVSFVHSQSPNHGQTGVQWPDYRQGAKNVVFRRHGNYVEDDDYRKAGIAFINSIAEQLQH